MSGPAPVATGRRTRLVRVVTVGVIVVLTVLGWLLVDGTGSSQGGVGPVPSATDRAATDRPTSSRTSPVGPASSPRPSGDRTTSAATDPDTGLRWVELAALPTQARTTVALIDAGGPFPYRKDGVVFSNRERLLPRQSGGYYHEYTVPTPGEGDRGARRIVAGDGTRQLFYTDDHYASFRRVRR